MILRGATGLVGLLGLFGVLVTTSVVTTSGCSAESACSVSVTTSRCAGLDLQSCSPGGGDWEDLGLCGATCTSDSCPAGPVNVCVTNPQGMGVCAVSPTAMPACATGASTACWLNDVVSCDTSGYVTSVQMACGNLTCATSAFDGGAFCAASATEIRECASGASTACWQNQVVDCDPTGYVRSVVQACGDLTCVDTAGCGPLCVLEGGPNPLCTPATASVCVDGRPTDCQCGYGVAAHPACGAADLCQTAPLPDGSAQTGAFCILSPTPLAACPSTGPYALCVGSTLVQCNTGWAVSSTPCPSECHAYSGVGSCG